MALTVQRPFLGIFLALMSHFLLDVLPHYGRKGETVIDWLRHRVTWLVEGLNIIGIPLLVFLLWGQPWWVFAAAGVAVAPDMVWIFRYFWYERYGVNAAKYALTRFHDKIQWGERPWGALVEVPFFLAVTGTVIAFVY